MTKFIRLVIDLHGHFVAAVILWDVKNDASSKILMTFVLLLRILIRFSSQICQNPNDRETRHNLDKKNAVFYDTREKFRINFVNCVELNGARCIVCKIEKNSNLDFKSFDRLAKNKSMICHFSVFFSFSFSGFFFNFLYWFALSIILRFGKCSNSLFISWNGHFPILNAMNYGNNARVKLTTLTRRERKMTRLKTNIQSIIIKIASWKNDRQHKHAAM